MKPKECGYALQWKEVKEHRMVLNGKKCKCTAPHKLPPGGWSRRSRQVVMAKVNWRAEGVKNKKKKRR